MNNRPPLYRIKPFKYREYSLDICGGGVHNRAPLVIYTQSNWKSQKFFVEKDGVIRNEKSKMVLTASNEDDPQRFEVVQMKDEHLDEQKWFIEDSNKDGCIIWSVKYPFLCLTVEEGTYADDTALVLQKYDGSVNQRFVLCK